MKVLLLQGIVIVNFSVDLANAYIIFVICFSSHWEKRTLNNALMNGYINK